MNINKQGKMIPRDEIPIKCLSQMQLVLSHHEQHISAASRRSRLESQWETPNFDPQWSQN